MTETAQDPAWSTCPRCAHAQAADQDRCARCRLSLTDPLTSRLSELNISVHEIDARLRAIDTTPGIRLLPGHELYQRRYTLLGERARHMQERADLLQRIDDTAQWREHSTAANVSESLPLPLPVSPLPQTGADFVPTTPGTSPATVQNLLLALGGVLLSAAAIAFTIFAWGNLDVEGRALILAAITALTLLAPWLLHRKNFTATSETVLVLGLFLLGLDGYAAWHVGWSGPLNAAGHTGVTLIAVALVGCCYSFLIPLRSPLPVGVVSAHMAVPFLAIGIAAEPMVFAAACLLVTSLDVTIATTSRIPSSMQPVLLFSAALAGMSALFVSAVHLANGAQFWFAVVVVAAIAALAVASAAFLTSDATLKHIALGGATVIWWVDASAVAARSMGALAPGRLLASALILLSLSLIVCRLPIPWRMGGVAGVYIVAAISVLPLGLATAYDLVAAWSGPVHAWERDAWQAVPASTFSVLIPLATLISAISVSIVLWVSGHKNWVLSVAPVAGALVLISFIHSIGSSTGGIVAIELTAATVLAACALTGLARTGASECVASAILLSVHATLWSIGNDTVTLTGLGSTFLIASLCAVIAWLKTPRLAWPFTGLATAAFIGELIAVHVWLGTHLPLEAYTLPAASIVLAIGLASWHKNPGQSSWLTSGPALLIGFIPTLLAVFIGTGGPIRPVAVALAALIALLTGLVAARQAPFLLGSIFLLVIAARTVTPLMPELSAIVPIWVPLAFAGGVVLGLGATWERRRQELAKATSALRAMR